jgi:hypothetical protein
MLRHILSSILAVSMILALTVTGCGKKEEPKPAPAPVQTPAPPPAPSVASVTLARGVNISWAAVNATTEFKPGDRVNALIKTENIIPGNMLGVRWQYLKTDQLVKADSIALKETGANSSSFYIERPKGLPPGDYRIDVWLNGAKALSTEFKVVQ